MTKNKILLILLSVLLVVLYLFEFSKLDKNLFTIFDEGYYYLTLQKAKNAEPNIGVSQWPYFITSLVNEQILSSIYSLRIVRFIFRISTFIFFFLFTQYYLGRQENNFYKLILALIIGNMAYFSIGDMLITGNYMQELFILMTIISVLISCSRKQPLYLIISGFFSFLSMLIIPPSGILITLACLLIVFLISIKAKINLYKSYLYYIIGIVLSVAFVHFVIVDLSVVYQNIFVGAKDLMSANRGYGPNDHILRLFFYFRDFFIQTCSLIGLYYVATIISTKTKPIVLWIIFTIGLFVFIFYIKKPDFSISTLWAFPMVLFVFDKIKNKRFRFSDLIRTNFDKNIINIFIFILPLISVLGTNTPYAGKMIAFILPWSILLFKLVVAKNTNLPFKTLVSIVIVVPLMINVSNIAKKNNSTKDFFTEGPVHKMKLNVNQFQYFQKVDSIFKQYNFTKNKDYVFATTFDHMTIVAFQAKALETFQLPEDFLQYRKKEMLPCPKFIFMTEYDKKMLSDEFCRLNWGFPQDYDVHFIGTPDHNSIWKSDRWLYCKKNK